MIKSMFRKIITLLVVIPLLTPLFGSEGVEYDIGPRVFNFVIFVAILYYLVFDKLVAFLRGRTKDIDDKFKAGEIELEALKIEKNSSQDKIEEANKKSKEIIEDAKKTSESLVKNIENSINDKIKNVEHTYEQRAEFDNKKAASLAVEDVLTSVVFKPALDELSQESIMEIIKKKVA